MKRRRDDDHDTVPFDFLVLFPEIRAHVRAHATPLARHLLRLTSWQMLGEDEYKGLPLSVARVAAWRARWPLLDRAVTASLVWWERELAAAEHHTTFNVYLAIWQLAPRVSLSLRMIKTGCLLIEHMFPGGVDYMFPGGVDYYDTTPDTLEDLRQKIHDWLDGQGVDDTTRRSWSSRARSKYLWESFIDAGHTTWELSRVHDE